jgi:hypothetical protein
MKCLERHELRLILIVPLRTVTDDQLDKLKGGVMARFLIAFCVLALLAVFATTASAQYVPPEENLIPEGPTSCTLNCTAVIACVLEDSSGNPIPNEEVTFALTSGPSDARLLTTTGITDAEGRASATVYVGSSLGAVEVTCQSGEAEATYVGQVLGSQFVPPTTGDAGLAAATGGRLLLGPAAFAALAGLTALRSRMGS